MSFLRDALVFLAAAVIAVPVATRLGLGSVLGYLAAGVAIGPAGLALAGDPHRVLEVAELGVVLLLFLIGLELDPTRLLNLRRAVFGLGGLQATLTAAVLAGLGVAAGLDWRVALIGALGLSLSSTALGLQLLGERRELQTAHGQAAFGILLFQDLAAIPMLALVPALGPGAADSPPALALAGRAAAVIAIVILAGRFAVRPLLKRVAALRNPELFTATALLLVASTALFVSTTGLSMELGSFLAGVLLANGEYRHELEADLAPFKGLLLGLFFLGIGMGADVGLLRERPAMILGLVAGLVTVKAAVAFAIGRRLVGGTDAAASLAILLSQGGEFGFVLFGLAGRDGVIPRGAADLLVLAVALSMATTPALFALHARFVRPRLKTRDPRAFDVSPEGEPPVIVAGFGRVGQVVGRMLRARRIPFTALDASPEHIDFIRRFGSKVFYGDASRLDLLRAARAGEARVFVLAIDDVEASMRTAEMVLEHFPQLVIFARARNRQHAYRLRQLGITHITRETLQSSIDLSAEVLESLGVDHDEAVAAGARLRQQDEAMFEESWRHAGDLEKLTDITNRGREELEKLFEQDAEQRRSA
jgi:monovalent cation:proton antiporter-2 (CPA2) family protein